MKTRVITIACITLFTALYTSVKAQSSTSRPQPTPEQVAERRKAQDDQLRNDWANLKKYAAQNEKVKASGSSSKSPVYIGDSITEYWFRTDSTFWKDNFYIDRGISGQTSSQMLVRFRQDVVNLKPPLVVINAGTNDIAENTGPISLELVMGNIASMAEIAKANNIKVVLSSVLPAAAFSWKAEIAPAEKVIQLNKMIKEYAANNNITYLDYWTSLANNVNGLDPKYANDGVHPTLQGYQVMEPLAKKAIDETLTVNSKKN